MTPAPTAVYIRVSSPKGQKTDSQRAELEAWLKRHKLKSVQWFEDRDSATNMDRAEFQKLKAAIFAGKVVNKRRHFRYRESRNSASELASSAGTL